MGASNASGTTVWPIAGNDDDEIKATMHAERNGIDLLIPAYLRAPPHDFRERPECANSPSQ